MDHASIPTDPAHLPIYVPCLSGLSYTEVDFDDYPAHRGWDVQRLLAGDFSQKTGSETAAFLQEWLYFVLLHAVLGDAFQKQLYVEPHLDHSHGRVTTKFLELHVQQRLTALRNILRDQPNTLWGVVEKVERCLTRLSYFCQMTDSSSLDWPLPPEVDLSLRALGVYLSSAFYGGLTFLAVQVSALPFLRFGGGGLLRTRMLAMGWCPSDVSLVLEQLSPSSAYYASLLKRPAAAGDHNACTGQKCLAFQLDENTYETRHVIETCKCSFLGPPLSDLIEIIESGGIPLLTIVRDEKSGNLSLQVVPYKSGRRYISFSHVWSDGLGNPRENKLPLCQIRRFKALLDELFDTASSLSHLNRGHFMDMFRRYRNVSMPFWLDSLCIPVRGEYSAVRTLAVSRIQDVFRNAYQVMVLDAELQNICIEDTYEGFMRISLSRWMRRLWTLLEGALGNRVHVKFKNRIFSLDDSYHETGPVRNPYSVFQRRQAPRVLLSGSLSADASMFYWKMRAFRASVVDPDEPKIYGYLRETSFDEKEKAAIRRRCSGIMEAFSASRYRTTSRTEDIYLCLANLLGWGATSLSSVPVEKRMRLLFESQTILPQGILFVQGLRMEEHGWKWAVTGFDDGRKLQAEGLVQDHTPGVRDMSGLTVVYPALALPSSSLTNGLENILVSTTAAGDGTMSWWSVTFADTNASNTFLQSAKGHTGDSTYSGWSASTEMCVLFYRPVPYVLPGVSMSAALVSLDRQKGHRADSMTDFKDAIQCNFVQLGLVQLLRSEEESSTLSRRSDLQLRRVEEPARFVEDRAWTVQ
ncbi:hypothetical protein PV04_04118 [Phialophora macrospora]|uniref:Heterokaryon incompatibility domain-containing protein n=1 Tax=Phialophora macrospora TaxID=1851006 RepID=A0A0D2E1E8_9EURO|nr:hypothetical protein PV04_04118 [Phialophora macrospora]